jgi:hypothetical protein
MPVPRNFPTEAPIPDGSGAADIGSTVDTGRRPTSHPALQGWRHERHHRRTGRIGRQWAARLLVHHWKLAARNHQLRRIGGRVVGRRVLPAPGAGEYHHVERHFGGKEIRLAGPARCDTEAAHRHDVERHEFGRHLRLWGHLVERLVDDFIGRSLTMGDFVPANMIRLKVINPSAHWDAPSHGSQRFEHQVDDAGNVFGRL